MVVDLGDRLLGFTPSPPSISLLFFYTMASFFNAEPVRALVNPEIGISIIALPLARRWWRS
jgi:hypothetical protein